MNDNHTEADSGVYSMNYDVFIYEINQIMPLLTSPKDLYIKRSKRYPKKHVNTTPCRGRYRVERKPLHPT